MDKNDLAGKLKERLRGPLPGRIAQEKLEPASRKALLNEHSSQKTSPKDSAVMILLHYQQNDLSLLFIQRAQYEGVHSGQIAFPGGRYEQSDKDLAKTAQRETLEETGIIIPDEAVLGKLTPLYIPPSNFNVQPYVGFLPALPGFSPDPKEVESVFTVPLRQLMGKDEVQKKTITYSNGFSYEIPCYVFGPHIIWGATSMILSEFLEIIESLEAFF